MIKFFKFYKFINNEIKTILIRVISKIEILMYFKEIMIY